MGKMYAEACRIIIYLGETNKASRLVFRYARNYGVALEDTLQRARN